MITDEKCQKLWILRTQRVDYRGGENSGGKTAMAYPVYSSEVKEWIQLFNELKLADVNYTENYKAVRNKNISTLTRDEILTYITFLIRTERFCEGCIADALNDGTFEKLCTRLHELTR